VIVLLVQVSYQIVPYPDTYSGHAGYFATGGNGLCEYDSSDFNQSALFVTAVNFDQWEAARHCGECLQVTNSSGFSILVTVVDRFGLAGTQTNNLTLSYLAFETLGGGGSGYIPISITWRSVPCPITTGVVIKSYSQDGYYLDFKVKNTVTPVSNFEVKINGIYTALTFTSTNNYVRSTGQNLMTPFNVRITAVTGEQITGTLNSFASLTSLCINQQFSSANPTTGATTGSFSLGIDCNASSYPVGLTSDGNTGYTPVTTGVAGITFSITNGTETSSSFSLKSTLFSVASSLFLFKLF